MQIIITITEKKDNGGRFPGWFGITKEGLLVCFTSPGAGIVIYADSHHFVGDIRTDWIEENFKTFYGTIEVAEMRGGTNE